MWIFTSVFVLWTIQGCNSLSDGAVYKGCYSTLEMGRKFGSLISPFLPDNCLKLCSGKRFPQAGLDSQHSICYCGEDMEVELATASVQNCSQCDNTTRLLCGGENSMALYEMSPNMTNEIASMFGEDPLVLVAGAGGVFSYNDSEKFLKILIEIGDYNVTALDYSLERGDVFALWNDSIFRFPLFEYRALTEKNATFITSMNGCFAFAVDWVHDMLFYPDCLNHRIVSVNLHFDHFPEETIVSPLDGVWALDMEVDPYKGLLFWTTGATLWSCRLDGHSLRKVVPEFSVNRVSSLSLDLATQRVYFFGDSKQRNETVDIFYTDYGGKVSPSILEFVGQNSIVDFGIYNNSIYFIKHTGGNTSALMSTKIGFSKAPTVIVKTKYYETQTLRLVHPRLHAPGKVDACTYHGCSFMCVEEAAVPHCYCPQSHELDLHNNKTCSLIPDEEYYPVVWRVIFGLILVLIGLLMAGMLMCLTDKLWSHMHHTVVTANSPGAPTDDQSESDTENLV